MKQPPLYAYSFDMQYALPWQMALTLGYQGSSGFHFLRLVDQNFLYPQSNGTCATGGACTPGVNQTPFNNAYVPTSDVHTDYNAMNVHLEKRLQHGLISVRSIHGQRAWTTRPRRARASCRIKRTQPTPEQNTVPRTLICAGGFRW